MITEIKKGDRFRCKRTFTEDNRILHIEGKEYISEEDGCITDEAGEKYDEWYEYTAEHYFTRIEPDSDVTQDLTREAIERGEEESVMNAQPIANFGYEELSKVGKIKWGEEPAKPMTDIREVVAASNAGKFTEEEMAVMLGIYENTPTPDIRFDGARQFDTGSKRDNDDNKPLVNHIDPYTRLRFGYHLRAGANHYGKSNWRLGQPTEAAIECVGRHLAKYELNLKHGIEQDEDHLSALIFNIQLIMMNEEKEGITVDHFYKGK